MSGSIPSFGIYRKILPRRTQRAQKVPGRAATHGKASAGKIGPLAQAPGRIGGIRSGRHRLWALTLGQSRGSRLRQTDAAVHLEMLLATTRTVTLAIFLIAEAGELVAAADAVAITRE